MKWTGFHGESNREAVLEDGAVIRVWKCLTEGCDNAVCTWASESLCFPCCESEVGHTVMVERFNATHSMTWEEAKADS